MSFTPKDWKDSPLTTTPISAAALEDLETRVTDYADDLTSNPLEISSDGVADHFLALRGSNRGNGTSYLTQFGLDGTNPGMLTNGYMAIVGASNAGSDLDDFFDSSDLSVGGHSAYMLGISSDIASDPVVVIQGGTGGTPGSLLKGYRSDGTTKVFDWDARGALTITVDSVTNPPLKVKQNASTDQTAVITGSGATQYVGLGITRTDGANEISLALAGAAGNFVSGSAQGDAVLKLTDSSKTIHIGVAGGAATLKIQDAEIGFFGGTPAAKPTVTGSRGGNAALASLLTALAGLGLLTDSSS